MSSVSDFEQGFRLHWFHALCRDVLWWWKEVACQAARATCTRGRKRGSEAASDCLTENFEKCTSGEVTTVLGRSAVSSNMQSRAVHKYSCLIDIQNQFSNVKMISNCCNSQPG